MHSTLADILFPLVFSILYRFLNEFVVILFQSMVINKIQSISWRILIKTVYFIFGGSGGDCYWMPRIQWHNNNQNTTQTPKTDSYRDVRTKEKCFQNTFFVGFPCLHSRCTFGVVWIEYRHIHAMRCFANYNNNDTPNQMVGLLFSSISFGVLPPSLSLALSMLHIFAHRPVSMAVNLCIPFINDAK